MGPCLRTDMAPAALAKRPHSRMLFPLDQRGQERTAEGVAGSRRIYLFYLEAGYVYHLILV